jgi:hypothetical protein
MARGLGARETLLVLMGAGITLLLMMSGFSVYRHEYKEAAAFSLIAGLLAYFFFRKRKVLLSLIGLTFVLVNAGLNNLARPSLPGYVTTYVPLRAYR